MNTRRGRGRQKPATDSPDVGGTTPPAKKNLLTPCRRMGLGRKRNVNSPVLGSSASGLVCTPISASGEEKTVVSETPPNESPSEAGVSETGVSEAVPSDAGASERWHTTPPGDGLPKGSSSRRKKSSNPLKRTLDDSQNSTEGKQTIVLLSPVHKKRKLELVDIFNSETSQGSSKSDSTNQKNMVMNDICPPYNPTSSNSAKSDIKCGKTISCSIKVSLPLELSQKYITSPPKPKVSDINTLLEVKGPKMVEIDFSNSDSAKITKNVGAKNTKTLSKNSKRNNSRDKSMESDINTSDLASNDDSSSPAIKTAGKKLIIDTISSKRRRNNNKSLLNDSFECDSMSSESVSNFVVKKSVEKRLEKNIIEKKSKRRQNRSKIPKNDILDTDSISSDTVPSIIEDKSAEESDKNIVAESKSTIKKTKLKTVENDTLILTKHSQKPENKYNLTDTKNTKRKKNIDNSISFNSVPNNLSNKSFKDDSIPTDLPSVDEQNLDENIFADTKFSKRKKAIKSIVDSSILDDMTSDIIDLKTQANGTKSKKTNKEKLYSAPNATIVDDIPKNTRSKNNMQSKKINSKTIVDLNSIENPVEIVKSGPRNAKKKKDAEKLTIEDQGSIEEKPLTNVDFSQNDIGLNTKKIGGKIINSDTKIESRVCLDDTMPIKKRKMRGKVENFVEKNVEDVENYIPCTLIDKTKVNSPEYAQRTEEKKDSSSLVLDTEEIDEKKITKSSQKTPSIVAQIVNDFNDDFDDDFREETPKTKSKLITKNKSTIEKCITRKKTQVLTPRNRKSNLIKNKYLSFNEIDSDLNQEDDITKIRQSKSLPTSSDSEDSIPLTLRKLGKEEKKSKHFTKKISDISEINSNKEHCVNSLGIEDQKIDTLEDISIEKVDQHMQITTRIEDNCEDSSLDSSKIEEMIIKQMDETRKENLANLTHEKSPNLHLKHKLLLEDTNEESHIGTFEKIISSTINDRVHKTKEEMNQSASHLEANEEMSSKIGSVYDFQSDSNEKVSLLDLRSKRKREGRLSITEESEYSSSNYTTPSFSPIDEIVKQSYEKELLIARNEVIEKLKEFDSRKRFVDEEIAEAGEDSEDSREMGEENERTREENKEGGQVNEEILSENDKNINNMIVDEEILNIIEDTRLVVVRTDQTSCRNEEINPESQIGVIPKPVNRFEYKSFDEDFEGFNNELLHQKQRLEKINDGKFSEHNNDDYENNTSILELKQNFESAKDCSMDIIGENIPSGKKSGNFPEKELIKKLLSDARMEAYTLSESVAKENVGNELEKHQNMVEMDSSETVKSQNSKHMGSDDSLESLPSLDVVSKLNDPGKTETTEKIVEKYLPESNEAEKYISEVQTMENVGSDDGSEGLSLSKCKTKLSNLEKMETINKIVKKNISEDQFTENVASDDSLESLPLLDRKKKLKSIENVETIEKIVDENISESKKPGINISEVQTTANVGSDDSVGSLPLSEHETKLNNLQNLETIEKIIGEEIITHKNSIRNIQDTKVTEEASLDDSIDNFNRSDRKSTREINLTEEKISENIISETKAENLSRKLRSGGKSVEKLLTKTVTEETPEKITFVKAHRTNRLSLKLKQESKKEVIDSFELKTKTTHGKYDISPIRIAKVILIPVEYEKKYRKYLTPPLKNNDKIYRVPKKDLDNDSIKSSKSITRRKKNVKKIDENDLQNGVMEKEFQQPSPSRRSFGLKISKIESNYDENDFDAFQKSVKTPKKIELSTKVTVKGNNSREESVFFTPPSSRSENDSDSNRNDFQTESEISPTSTNSNPFGEGTSKRITLKELSVSNLTEIIGIPPSKSPRILSPEIIDSMFKKHERCEEDKEVEDLVPKSPARRTPSRGKKRKNSIRSSLSNKSRHNLTNDQTNFETDSDDDFVSPRSQSASKTVIKDESGTKSKLKSLLKKKTDLLNRAENFRITKSSTITALHKGHVVAYVKSHDNDITLKTTESDDNQKVSNPRSFARDTMIIERYSYRNSDRVPSMFDSVVDDPETYLASQEIVATPKKRPQNTRSDIKDEIIQTERRIKEKEAKLERLKLIGVYKRTHDLGKLTKVTAQIKKGCQDALLELAAVLRQTSYTPFDMATLLHNMHIPNEQVGYNPELDEFI